jgi:hypothetical protein
VWEIVHRPQVAFEISEAEISATEARNEISKAHSRRPIRMPMALPRRSTSPLIYRRLTLVASLARSHGDPCINVLLGISADRRRRNGVGTGVGMGE